MTTSLLKKHLGKKITHNCPGVEWRGGDCISNIEAREVTLMAFAKGYAMVRRPRAFPYVAPIKELSA